MNVGELETAGRLGHPLVVLVWTDGSYGLIEMHQRRQFGQRHRAPGSATPTSSPWRVRSA